MSKRKNSAKRLSAARWPRIDEVQECARPADQPLTVLPDADLVEATPLENGWRLVCRGCGMAHDVQLIPEGLVVPNFSYVYDVDGRLRYRTFPHLHDRCPALARIDAVAREHEQRIADRVH